MVLYPRNGSYRTMGESFALTADSELIQSDDLRGYWKCEVLLYLSGNPTNRELTLALPNQLSGQTQQFSES
jgi:hypothetical protein